MNPELPDSPKNKSKLTNILPKSKKILLAILLALILLIIAFAFGFYISRFSIDIYCHTVVLCQPARPTLSPKMMATIVAGEYELALQEIKEGNYERAKQRLEYVILYAPENLEAKEKLVEVEKLLQITPTP
jgi:hypothetical protein